MNKQPDLFSFEEEEEKQKIIDSIANLEKVDLHRHLTGSIRFSTAIDIIKKHHIELPYMGHNWTEEEIKKRVVLDVSAGSLKKFIGRPWGILNRLLVDVETIERIAFEIVEDASLENISYLEVRFSPYGLSTQHKAISYNARGFMQAIIRGINRAQNKYPTIDTKIILSVPRHVVAGTIRSVREKYFEEFIQLMKEFKSHVVGADLTGVEEESGNDLFLFEPLFKEVKREGFGITIHSGEISSAKEVWFAIERLGADRIGHGIKSIEDKDLIKYLATNDIALEICLRSNLLTGAVENIESHPAYELFKQGVPITINTDNTLVCNTDINKEYELLITHFDFSREDIGNIMQVAKNSRFSKNSIISG